jgi:hypothetical protein
MQEVVPKQWVNRFDVVDPDAQLTHELARLDTKRSPLYKLVMLSKKTVETLVSKWFGR